LDTTTSHWKELAITITPRERRQREKFGRWEQCGRRLRRQESFKGAIQGGKASKNDTFSGESKQSRTIRTERSNIPGKGLTLYPFFRNGARIGGSRGKLQKTSIRAKAHKKRKKSCYRARTEQVGTLEKRTAPTTPKLERKTIHFWPSESASHLWLFFTPGRYRPYNSGETSY